MTVELNVLRDLADRVAIRLELGEFVMKGPRENIMEVESRVAWSAVAGQLHHEGYPLVPPEEYAEIYGLTPEQVMHRVEEEGTLFALYFEGHDETFVLVPLENRDDEERKDDDRSPIPR
ncbi:hypothetical protein [Geomesophilobacter sediminis]|uniref:Uncharacterized protein n=1 Tax=Geomesophilobacter sediminis TaxID=2798584 RepID=A0A8J7LV14_9BACT|nr:hypothetical protein [Geomesophilobacter sediminis]MBJ6725279.1 hypothetical protein [Geomesophilobacter sediminis]